MYPEDQAAKIQYAPPSHGVLGAIAGHQVSPGHAAATARDVGQSGAIDVLRSEMHQTCASLAQLNERIRAMNDRVFGATPRGVSGGEANKPSGIIGEIDQVWREIKEQINVAHSGVENLSKLTGN